MKRILTVGVIAALGITALTLFSQCELFYGPGNANVIIDLGAPGNRAAAPTNIISYTLTVTAPDMARIVKTVSAGARYLNMYIPVGKERTLRLDANLDPATQPSLGPDFLLSKAGERTVDLLPGRIVMLAFTMGAGETKILIPDTYNTRLVEIPSLHPASVSDWSEYSSGAILDIDFDKDGQLYYVVGPTIFRLPSFSPSPAPTPSSAFSSIFPSSISLDISTSPSTAYFNGGASVYSCPLGGSTPTLITLPSPPNITTLNAVRYSNGVLYGVGEDSMYNAMLFRYVIGGAITSVSAPNGNYAWMDLIIKGNRIFVANYPVNPNTPTDPANSASIDVYDKNTLARIGSYGRLTTMSNDTRPGYFYGPRLFINKTSKKFYVIDDAYASGIGGNRIVSFDDPATWSGWETFRGEDLPPNTEFRFFVPAG